MAGRNSPTLGPFRGINNRLPLTQLGVYDNNRKAGDYLADAVDVDLTDAGTVRRRAGYARALTGSYCRSLLAQEDGSALFADRHVLYRAREVAGQLVCTALVSGLSSTGRLTCAEQSGVAFVSDGEGFWRVEGDTAYPHGVPVPAVVPTLTAGMGGSLAAGVYRVLLTYRDVRGEQSGSSQAAAVSVPPNGRLTIGGLPALVPDGVADVLIYMTAANGDVFYLTAEIGAGSGVIAVSVPPMASGARCHTLRLHPLPAGRIVRLYLGRLLSAAGSVLYRSLPYSYGLYDPAADFVMFPEDITMVAPVEGGVYVCADRTYFVSGDFESMREVLPCGAAFGSDVVFPDRKRVAWFSPRGFVVAEANGEVKTPQDDVLVFDPAVQASSLVREQSGIQQLLSSLRNPARGSVAARKE